MAPQAFPDGTGVFYLAKVSGSSDTIQTLNFADNARRVLREEGIASEMRPALAPDGKSFAVNVPAQDKWNLWLSDLKGNPPIQIASRRALPADARFQPGRRIRLLRRTGRE